MAFSSPMCGVVRSLKVAGVLLSLVVMGVAGGCKSTPAPVIPEFKPDVDTKTEGWGLRKLEPGEYPDMKLAWMDKSNLEKAIDKSLQFLKAPSSQRFYPSNNPGDTITHAQEVATLNDIKDMIHKNITPDQFQAAVLQRYDVYTSVGYNNKGDVWFTGYFTPIYHGSRTQTAEYKYPIYSRPSDLVSDPLTGEVKGQYPTRRELVQSGKLKGSELLWFKKPLEPFMVQVQGSAQVILPTGETLYVGYSGSNGREHKGLGTQLRDEGKIDAKHLSLPAVIGYFDEHPDQLEEYVLRDDRFTFQKIYTAAEKSEWPTGSLNVQVTTDRSLATDKNIFPRASFTMIDVPKPAASGELMPYQGFLLDQDSGGGIRAAGRADIYMGIGDAAGKRAGLQFAEGKLYYMFLKPQFVPAAAPVAAPVAGRGLAPAGRAGAAAPAGTRGAVPAGTARPAGGDEMFPGAVRGR